MKPQISHPNLSAFAGLADRFCDTIERRDWETRAALLQQVHQQLPELYAAALQLPSLGLLYEGDDQTDGTPISGSPSDPVTGTEAAPAKTLADLRKLIGDWDYYREVFDPYLADDPEVTGSLADDLADIYRDLWEGRLYWSRGQTGEALFSWRNSFEGHWGEHASGALRALFALSAWSDLDWPEHRERAT